MLRINNLTKKYTKRFLVRNVTFDVTDGDVVALIGPSEREKRFILRCINLFDRPDSGEISLNGDNILQGAGVKNVRKKIATVFTDPCLLPDRMVVESVMTAPVHLLKKSKKEAYKDAMELLSLVGLKEKSRFFPDELDEGAQRRVAIARALAMKPDVLLLENPTANLEPSLVYEISMVLKTVAETGQTMLFSTNDHDLARLIATKVVFINNGSIAECGVPKDVLDNPIEQVTEEYVKNNNKMSFKIFSNGFDFMRLSGELAKFCTRNGIGKDNRQKMQNSAYGLLTECVVPFVKNGYSDMLFTVEIHGSKNLINMTLEFSDDDINPLVNPEAERAVGLIRNNSSQIKYTYGNGKNIITVMM